MADSRAGSDGREMLQPYDGPMEGPGIAAHGTTADGGRRAAMGFAEMIADTVRVGPLNLRVQAASESFCCMFDASRAAVEGRLVYHLDGGVWNRPELMALLERVLPESHVFDEFEVEVGEGEGRRVFDLNGRRLNHHQMVLLAVADVTERVLAREALEQAHEAVEEAVRGLERRVEARQVRTLAAKLADAGQEERRRLALVLHDDLQQHLFGATCSLELLARATSPDDRDRFLDRTRRALTGSIAMARSLAAELSPSVLDADGLGGIVRWLAGRKRELFGLTVEGDAAVPDHRLRILLYNVVREALFNVAKDAGTERAQVVLEEADGHIVVRVEDEGRGVDARSLSAGGDAGGFGLPSVRERLEAVGGRLDVASAVGEGTHVTLTVPQEPAELYPAHA